MNHHTRMRDIAEKLIEMEQTPHFIIRYLSRNPLEGNGGGSSGVINHDWVDTISDNLEKSYELMKNSPYNRKAPKVGQEGKTLVYIFDLREVFPRLMAPLTDVDLEGVPYICLPNRNDEPTNEAAHFRLAAEVAHEVTHLFNTVERPMRALSSAPWAWLDEGMAVQAEEVLLPENFDSLRFGGYWCDKPEFPLDSFLMRYQAGMFVRFIENELGSGFVSQVWKTSNEKEKPFETIERLLPQFKAASISGNVTLTKLFQSYCLHAYFLNDPKSSCYAPKLYARHGSRVLQESHQVAMKDTQVFEDYLDHLSCSYYRFAFDDEVQDIEIEVSELIQKGTTPIFRAEIAEVTTNLTLGNFTSLEPNKKLKLTVTKGESIVHFIVVISNCGLRAQEKMMSVLNDDQQYYKLRISAL